MTYKRTFKWDYFLDFTGNEHGGDTDKVYILRFELLLAIREKIIHYVDCKEESILPTFKT